MQVRRQWIASPKFLVYFLVQLFDTSLKLNVSHSTETNNS